MKKLKEIGKALVILFCFVGLFLFFFIFILFIVFLTASGFIAVPFGLTGLLGFRWVVSPLSPPALIFFGLGGLCLSVALSVSLYRIFPKTITWFQRFRDKLCTDGQI